MTLALSLRSSLTILAAALEIASFSSMTSLDSAAQASKLPAATVSQSREKYGQLPLSFEANQGQAGPRIKFLSRGDGYSLFLTDSEAVLALGAPTDCRPQLRAAAKPAPCASGAKAKQDIVRMTLAGALRSTSTSAAGEDQLPGKVNYFLGNDPANWRSNLPTYAKVRYTGVYPGIDLVYYGNQRQLEYDFVVAPGVNPDAIHLTFSGQKQVRLAANGDLALQGRNGTSTLRKPTVYQEKDGQRQVIPGSFQLTANRTVRFALGNYDHSRPLIIDPVLVYSTYLGGSAAYASGDSGNGIAVDSAGDAYVVGTAYSTDFPVTAGSFQAQNNGAAKKASTVFVTKFNATGTALVYSTYLGGSSGDFGSAIGLDSAGNAYVTGLTGSSDFPVTAGGLQSVNKSFANGAATAFVTKLNAAGSALIYSTYLGGTHPAQCSSYLFPGGEAGRSIAVDGQGRAYVTGYTTSADFPVTAGAFQTTYPASSIGAPNGFVAKLASDGASLAYSTYLGGSGSGAQCYIKGDQPYAIAIDSAGDAYVAGGTTSTDFPVTSGALKTTNPGGIAFVTVLNPTGGGEIYSTFLGGSSQVDFATALAVDSLGNAYVGGSTSSPDFPTTAGVLYPSIPGPNGPSGFAAKLNASGTSLEYSTFLASPLSALAVDSTGNAYVTGVTGYAPNPTTPDAITQFTPLVQNFPSEAYVAKLNPSATAMEYATMLGSPSGAYRSAGNAEALDSSGNLYVTGSAAGNDFPTTSGAFQTINNSDATPPDALNNAFVTKLALAEDTADHGLTTTMVSASPAQLNQGQSVTVTATVKKAQGGVTPTGSVTFAGISNPLSGTTVFPAVTATLNGSGIATWTSNSLAPGYYSPGAYYQGDAAHLSSNVPDIYNSSPVFFRVVGPPALLTGFEFGPGPYVYGSTQEYLYFTVTDSAGYGLKGVTVNLSGTGLTFFPSNTVVTNNFGAVSVLPSATTVGNLAATASAVGVAKTVTLPLTILQAPMTIAVQPVSNQRYYGAANPKINYFIQGLVNGDTVGSTINVNIQAPGATSPAGSYQLTATISGSSAPNYALTVKNAPFTILPARLSITPLNYKSQYGQTPPAPTAYTLSGFLNGDTASVVSGAPALSTSATAASPPGNYLITVGPGTLTATNYTFKASGTPGYLQIVKAPLTVSLVPATASRIYGAGNPSFTYSASGLVNGDTITVTPSTTATAASPVGHYPVTATVGGAAAAYYKIAVNNATLSVTPAPLTVTVLPATASRIYGAGNPSFTYTATGLVNGDTLTPSTTATPASPVGTYPVTVTGAALSNYSPTIHAAALTVKPAPLSLAATSYKSTYGQTPSAPTAYTLTGFVNGDTSSVVSGAPALSTRATAASPVGYYPIQVGAGSLSAANYTFAVKGPQANLGITKAPLTVKADNLTMSHGGPIPPLTWSFTGFVNGDTSGTATTGTPSLSTAATTHSAPGTYPIYINLSTLKSANYSITTMNGVMTITP